MRSIYVSEAVRLRSVCHGAGPPSFPNCRFRFLGPPGFGGNDQGGRKGIEALAASTKNREEEWAAWWMLSASKSREGRCSAI